MSMLEKIVSNEIIIKNLDEDKQYDCMKQLYMEILTYVYGDEETARYNLLDFTEYFGELDKNNKDILIEIRDDILHEIKKSINYCIFEDVDVD